MIPDLPFLFSIAALSGSLAGLAGLVGGLRRGEGLRTIDRFRLREIVEFAFANTLLALSLVPLANVFGEVEPAIRVVAAVALVYLLGNAAILFRRMRAARIASTTWIVVAALLDVLIIVAAVAAIVTASIAAMQSLLLLLVARPMTAFLFVLVSFDAPDVTPAGPGTPAD